MTKFYEETLSTTIKERLAALEVKSKPARKVTARVIIERFKEEARKALQRGYTLEEITQIANEAGLEISVSTLKVYLRSKKKKVKPGESKPAAASAPTGPAPGSEVKPPSEQPSSSRVKPSSHAGFNEDN
jgi:transposase